jgi:hypothetical protein
MIRLPKKNSARPPSASGSLVESKKYETLVFVNHAQPIGGRRVSPKISAEGVGND